MIPLFLIFLIVSALLLVREKRVVRLIILLGVFSLVSSVCFFLLSAPDIAMAEAVVSALSTILFIVCFEKYYSKVAPTSASASASAPAPVPSTVLAPASASTAASGSSAVLAPVPSGSGYKPAKKGSPLLPLAFTALLGGLFILLMPENTMATALKDRYISSFGSDFGGENAVTAIVLGYRMYDTLFEALMLLVSIVAVVHLSRHEDAIPAASVHPARHEGATPATSVAGEAGGSAVTGPIIRAVCPILLLLSVYLAANGHLSPGGGFHAGVAAAAFFVCRYMLRDISDMDVNKPLVLEKVAYLAIIALGAYFILFGAREYLPVPGSAYLVAMNLLLGLKVACGFFVIFYRFIVFERR